MPQQLATPPAMLVILDGPQAGRRILLSRSVCAIGTDPRCHLRPPDPTLSPVHATIHLHQGGYYVKDQRSRNGTFVNNQRADLVRLRHGDTLRLGGLSFRFEHAAGSPQPRPSPAAATSALSAVRARPEKPSVGWTARLYSLMLVALLLLGAVAVVTAVANSGASPPPPPPFNPATASPATILYFYADW